MNNVKYLVKGTDINNQTVFVSSVDHEGLPYSGNKENAYIDNYVLGGLGWSTIC